jgi:proteic killer suppression protein
MWLKRENTIQAKAADKPLLWALKGELKGFYSIRINSQWRIIFRWAENSASDVQIVDYH